jgi:hypothetical protein
MKWIPIENLIGWKTSTMAGVEVLTQIRIKECVTEPDSENPYQDKNVDQIRVVNRGGAWETFREQKRPTENVVGDATRAARSARRKFSFSRSTSTATIS